MKTIQCDKFVLKYPFEQFPKIAFLTKDFMFNKEKEDEFFFTDSTDGEELEFFVTVNFSNLFLEESTDDIQKPPVFDFIEKLQSLLDSFKDSKTTRKFGDDVYIDNIVYIKNIEFYNLYAVTNSGLKCNNFFNGYITNLKYIVNEEKENLILGFSLLKRNKHP